ncbi:hypothetical protein SFR_2515 [Streptomyces sp. FR-008]|nr:hypothetical protein SFR_2515 [Streptomyces sp. FR-008]
MRGGGGTSGGDGHVVPSERGCGAGSGPSGGRRGPDAGRRRALIPSRRPA